MKNSHRFLGNLIAYLPMLYLTLIWDQLPNKVPVHFTEAGEADQFAARATWLWTLLIMFVLLIIFRSSIFTILTKQSSLPNSRIVTLHFLTAAFVASLVMTYILQTSISAPIYTDYLPVLMSFFSASGIYFAVSTKPIVSVDAKQGANIPARRLAVMQHLQAVSRLATVRVNLLAGCIMLFAQSSDRWMIGILANLLTFAALALLFYSQLRDAG